MSNNDARQITGSCCQQVLKKARRMMGWRRAYTKTRWVDANKTCFAIFGSAADRAADHEGKDVEYVYTIQHTDHATAFFKTRTNGYMHEHTKASHAW